MFSRGWCRTPAQNVPFNEKVKYSKSTSKKMIKANYPKG